MIRTQIQLEPETWEALRKAADEQGKSVSEVVRESVKSMLNQSRQRALGERLLEVCGKYRSGLGDLARNHDRYLEDGF